MSTSCHNIVLMFLLLDLMETLKSWFTEVSAGQVMEVFPLTFASLMITSLRCSPNTPKIMIQ